MLGLPGRIREDDVAPLGKILADSASRCARRVENPDAPGSETFVCDRPELPRAVVYRDSMAIPLIPLLAENFSRVVFVSSRGFDPALIEREKPDIVIEEMVERTLHAPGALPMSSSGTLAARQPRGVAALALAQFRLEAEFLDLARQRVAAPAQPRGGLHPVAAGMRQRAPDQRSFEFLFQPIADIAFPSRQRLREFAVERLLPAGVAGDVRAPSAARGLRAAGRPRRRAGPAPSR